MSRALSKSVLTILTILLAWQLGQIGSRYFEPMPVLVIPNPALSQAQSSNSSSQKTPQISQPVYLLGRHEVTEETKKTTPEAVTVSKLNLKLLGILALSDERGVAIIQSGSRTLSVSTGEQVQNGVTLEAVYPGYVLINHRGKSEKLVMDSKNSLVDESAIAVNSGSNIDRHLNSVTQEIRKSPMKINQYVRFQLVNRGGRVGAIKVWPKKDKALFNALGFQSGDLLQKINGHSISVLMQKPALWQKMLNETTFDLEVERQGHREKIIVNLD